MALAPPGRSCNQQKASRLKYTLMLLADMAEQLAAFDDQMTLIARNVDSLRDAPRPDRIE